jgi:Domain of unknown function (DUF4136)
MNSFLMTRVRWLAGVCCALWLAACTSAPTVRSDFDRSVDFASYKTFAFVSPLGTDRSGYQSIVSQRLKVATQRELENRGLRRVETDAQLLVNFNAKLNEQLYVSSAPVPTMGVGVGRGYYGYRAGMYGTWPLYYNSTTVTQYTEGTLNVDVVDAARKQLVWEGVVTQDIGTRERENVEAAIDAAVVAAFSKFPVPGPAKKP